MLEPFVDFGALGDDVDINLGPAPDAPGFYWHGTTESALNKILSFGLSRFVIEKPAQTSVQFRSRPGQKIVEKEKETIVTCKPTWLATKAHVAHFFAVEKAKYQNSSPVLIKIPGHLVQDAHKTFHTSTFCISYGAAWRFRTLDVGDLERTLQRDALNWPLYQRVTDTVLYDHVIDVTPDMIDYRPLQLVRQAQRVSPLDLKEISYLRPHADFLFDVHESCEERFGFELLAGNPKGIYCPA